MKFIPMKEFVNYIEDQVELNFELAANQKIESN